MDRFINLLKNIHDIRRLYDFRAVLGLDANKKKIICPLPGHTHHNNTPSFHIFPKAGHQQWQCFGNCGKWVDVIDLKGYMEIPGYDPKDSAMVRQAISLLFGNHEISIVAPEAPSADLSPTERRKYLPPGPEVVRYAERRGLMPETLAKFHIGQYKHFMSIPIFEEGVLKMIKFRNTRPASEVDDSKFDRLRFWAARGSAKSLYNYDAVAYTERPVLIVKDEIPAMLLNQYGLLACAPSSGEGSYVDQWKHLLAFSSRKVVVGDNDWNPAVRVRMQAKAVERAKVLDAEVHFPPEGHKDIDEWILADPDNAIPTIQGWMST